MLRNINWNWLRSWEILLAAVLVLVVLVNIQLTPFFLGVNNLVNVFQLSIEKIIVALTMALIIINGEIDLSVASIMGFSASIFGLMVELGASAEVAALTALAVAGICGAFNGFWIAYLGLPSLAVTLAGLVGYRGAARILLEDRSVSGFPDWFNGLGQPGVIGPLSAGIVIFAILFIIFAIILHFTAFGRYVYIIGNNQDAARYAGVRVKRVKMMLFVMSGLMAGLAGLLLASRLGSARADVATGFELDIITMVLLGGVSIFGGTGTLVGVGLSILVVLNLRNGMGLANYSGSVQTTIVGILLIMSVLGPNIAQNLVRLRRSKLHTAHEIEKEIA